MKVLRVILRMIENCRGNGNLQVVTNTKDQLRMTLQMVMENQFIKKVVLNILVNLKMVLGMAKVKKSKKTVLCI